MDCRVPRIKSGVLAMTNKRYDSVSPPSTTSVCPVT